MKSHRLTSVGDRRNTKYKLSVEIANQIASSVRQLQNAPFSRIDEVGRFAFGGDYTARFRSRGEQRPHVKFSIVTDFGDGQRRGDGSSGVENFLLNREIDVVQTSTGSDRVGDFSTVPDVQAHYVVLADHEQKAPLRI